jgi:hypothetical protein
MNGVHTIENDGKWEGVIQIGNVEYPPHEGDIVEIAVSIVNSDEAHKLLSADGVVVRGGPAGKVYDKAIDATVHLR